MIVVPPSHLRISSHVMAYPYEDESSFSLDVEPNYKERAGDRWESVKMRVLRARSVIAIASDKMAVVHGEVTSGNFASADLVTPFIGFPSDEKVKFTMFGDKGSVEQTLMMVRKDKDESDGEVASRLLMQWVDRQIIANILRSRTLSEHAISGFFHGGKKQQSPLMLRGVSAVLSIPGVAHSHWGCYDGFMFWIGSRLTKNDIDHPQGAISQWLGGSRDWVNVRRNGAGAEAIVDGIRRSRDQLDWLKVPRY